MRHFMPYEFIYEFMYMKTIMKSYLKSCVPRFQMGAGSKVVTRLRPRHRNKLAKRL